MRTAWSRSPSCSWSNASTKILKTYVLPRSDLGLSESTPATLNSLPSGHTTAAFSIVVALLFVVPRGLRPIIAGVGIVASSAVALATLSAGWHRVADSLASFLLVSTLAALGGVVVLLADPRFVPDTKHGWNHRTGRWWTVLSVGLALVAAALIAVLVTDEDLRLSALGPPAAFGAGGLLIVATAAAATSLVVRIVARVSDPLEAGSGNGRRSGGARGVAGPHLIGAPGRRRATRCPDVRRAPGRASTRWPWPSRRRGRRARSDRSRSYRALVDGEPGEQSASVTGCGGPLRRARRRSPTSGWLRP